MLPRLPLPDPGPLPFLCCYGDDPVVPWRTLTEGGTDVECANFPTIVGIYWLASAAQQGHGDTVQGHLVAGLVTVRVLQEPALSTKSRGLRLEV